MSEVGPCPRPLSRGQEFEPGTLDRPTILASLSLIFISVLLNTMCLIGWITVLKLKSIFYI